MGAYSIYVTNPVYVNDIVRDVEAVGGRVITVSTTFGIVVAEIPDSMVGRIAAKRYVRMVEKSYPFEVTTR